MLAYYKKWESLYMFTDSLNRVNVLEMISSRDYVGYAIIS